MPLKKDIKQEKHKDMFYQFSFEINPLFYLLRKEYHITLMKCYAFE